MKTPFLPGLKVRREGQGCSVRAWTLRSIWRLCKERTEQRAAHLRSSTPIKAARLPARRGSKQWRQWGRRSAWTVVVSNWYDPVIAPPPSPSREAPVTQGCTSNFLAIGQPGLVAREPAFPQPSGPHPQGTGRCPGRRPHPAGQSHDPVLFQHADRKSRQHSTFGRALRRCRER